MGLRVQGVYRLDSESIGVKPLEKGRYDWSADPLALHALQRTVTMRALRLATHPSAVHPQPVGLSCRCEGISAAALEFAILTAPRTNEVLGARWQELNKAARV